MRFVYQPAEDETVDAEHELRHDNGDSTNISIQDCRSYGGGYAVNEYGPPEDFWMRQVSEHRSLKAAKAAALAHFGRRS